MAAKDTVGDDVTVGLTEGVGDVAGPTCNSVVAGSDFPPSLSVALTEMLRAPAVAYVWDTDFSTGPITVSTVEPSPQSTDQVNRAAMSALEGSLAPSCSVCGTPTVADESPVTIARGAKLVIVSVVAAVPTIVPSLIRATTTSCVSWW